MGEKFIENIIEDFFETGVLECSIFQLNTIYDYAKSKVQGFKPTNNFTEDQIKWLNFYKMILIYITETTVRINGVNENLKVNFHDYLIKVYGISEGEISEQEYDYLYLKYVKFIEENCCSNCMSAGSTSTCKKCACGEVLFSKNK